MRYAVRLGVGYTFGHEEFWKVFTCKRGDQWVWEIGGHVYDEEIEAVMALQDLIGCDLGANPAVLFSFGELSEVMDVMVGTFLGGALYEDEVFSLGGASRPHELVELLPDLEALRLRLIELGLEPKEPWVLPLHWVG